MSSREEYFIFMKSTDSLNYFPSNTNHHFTVELPEAVYLDGNDVWYCALRHFTCELTSPMALYVYCDLVQQSFVLDRRLPIIQYIPKYTRETRVTETYDSSMAFKVTRSTITNITVYIKDEKFKHPSFTDEPSTCTLHLMKRGS